MADQAPDPSVESTDYKAMKDDWRQIADIRAGARAVRARGTTYLPQYEKETTASYKRRLAYTPWRPLFVDALRNLCSKPFTQKVSVNEDASEDIQGKIVDQKTRKRQGGFVDDVDGQGNHLHVFARDTFTNGVAMGLAAILVDYPTMAPGLTVADEKAAGARPYWVQVPAQNIIALYTKVVGGRIVVSHIRIKECVVERSGFEEVERNQIRVLELDDQNRPVWQLWELQKKQGEKAAWVKIADGQITLPEIPVALFFTGERSGNYRVKPPLVDLAVMQIEIYRSLSRKDEIFTYAGSPMLKAVGLNPPAATPILDENGNQTGETPAPQLEVGPKTILFAPPVMEGTQPDWDFIQPDAQNLKAVGEDIDAVTKEFNRLALQPTMPGSGTITATASAIDAAKSHSAIEAWANGLADTLNQAFKFTMEWMKKADTVTVNVHTDFGVDVQGTEEAKVIGDAEKRGVISKKTEREELSRRGILGPNFSEDQEEQRLAEEQQGLEAERDIDPITGEPIKRPDPAEMEEPTLQ